MMMAEGGTWDPKQDTFLLAIGVLCGEEVGVRVTKISVDVGQLGEELGITMIYLVGEVTGVAGSS